MTGLLQLSQYNILKMRFFGILFVIVIFLLAKASDLHGQEERVSISFSDTTIEAVLNEIRNQTDINFIYNHEEIHNFPPVSIQLTNATVKEVLDLCFKNSSLGYTIISKTIIISPGNETDPATEISLAPSQTLRGRVVDQDSKIPLPFATVIVLNTDPVKGGVSDEKGYFRIEKLKAGRYSIRVSYVGYEDVILPEILVGSGKQVIITVALREKTEQIDEVWVNPLMNEPLNQMAMVSARSFSVEETQRYAASISDPARMAQVFAGVSGYDDATNEIIIRGNSPNWMSWRLEGVEIPSPNHFSEEGYTSGAVSILSSNMLARSDFYTGAFPAEFGSALSGVFDLRLRNGNNREYEYTAEAGVLGIDLSAEGPFKKGYDGSFLLNYRYSTFALINKLNVRVSENILPNYTDLSFKVNLPAGKAGTFSIWGLGGLSDDNEKYIPDFASGEDPEEGYSDYTEAGMYSTGITHLIYPDDKSYLRTVISNSLSTSSETYERMDSLRLFNLFFYDELQHDAIRISSVYNKKISAKLTFRTGISLNFLNFDYFSKYRDSVDVVKTFINSKGNTYLFQGFLQSKFRFSNRIVFTVGLHAAHFKLNDELSLEPRMGCRINLPGDNILSFGAGLHSKNENLPVYFVEKQNPDGSLYKPNLSLGLIKSAHFVAGYEKLIGPDISVKTEIYYQRIFKLPVPDNPEKLWPPSLGAIYPDDTLANIGEGRNYGIEFTFQKFFTNSYYILVTGSFFDAKFKPADGNWYNSKYNINHITNLVGGKEFMIGENKLLGLNAKLIWAGGKRVIPVDLNSSIKRGEAVFDNNALFSKRLKDYFRIDFGTNIHFFREKTEHIISLDIQNLTNRINTLAEDYDPKRESIREFPLAGIIPILNYRLEF